MQRSQQVWHLSEGLRLSLLIKIDSQLDNIFRTFSNSCTTCQEITETVHGARPFFPLLDL